MPDVVAFFAGAFVAVLMITSDWQKDWTPQFITVLAIVSAVCVAALIVGAIDRGRVKAAAPSTCPCCRKEAA